MERVTLILKRNKMKKTISVFIILAVIIVISCTNSNQKTSNGRYVYISETDSVCLDLYTDIDSTQIKEIVNKTNSRVLLIFTGFSIHQNDILSNKYLTNPEIRKELETLTLIRLNVDNNKKKNISDSLTIGNANTIFQRNKFNTSSQPYCVFVSKDLRVNGESMGYTSNVNDIIKFLRQ
ncbi:MAG: hypothetical protein ACXWFB_11845 [Nitrososphaeraceae archaeon]